MHKFQFRLQRVLDYRARLEEKAERLYGEARSQRELAEARLISLREDLRQSLNGSTEFCIHRSQRRLLFIEAMDDRIRQQEIIVQTLAADEETLRARWLSTRQDRETLEKLRQKAMQTYQHESEQHAQRELDEWAVLRRQTA